jgi:hypothetical protein
MVPLICILKQLGIFIFYFQFCDFERLVISFPKSLAFSSNFYIKKFPNFFNHINAKNHPKKKKKCSEDNNSKTLEDNEIL